MNKAYRYLTIDSVNAATAEVLAAQCGLDLEVVEPRDLPRLERERAKLVLDWDFLPADYQEKLLNGTAVNIVAIHGYNLSESLAGFLQRRGIVYNARLEEQLFQALAQKDSAA